MPSVSMALLSVRPAIATTAPNEEIDKTEIEDMYPAPTSNLTKIIVSSILPVVFIVFEIGFWSYNRSSVSDDDWVYVHFPY